MCVQLMKIHKFYYTPGMDVIATIYIASPTATKNHYHAAFAAATISALGKSGAV
jgi:hypothetical protein